MIFFYIGIQLHKVHQNEDSSLTKKLFLIKSLWGLVNIWVINLTRPLGTGGDHPPPPPPLLFGSEDYFGVCQRGTTSPPPNFSLFCAPRFPKSFDEELKYVDCRGDCVEKQTTFGQIRPLHHSQRMNFSAHPRSLKQYQLVFDRWLLSYNSSASQTKPLQKTRQNPKTSSDQHSTLTVFFKCTFKRPLLGA